MDSGSAWPAEDVGSSTHGEDLGFGDTNLWDRSAGAAGSMTF
jgi:hypothetical protein